MMVKLTVRRVRRRVHVQGYRDPDIQIVQQLGYTRFWQFVVVDEEIVPDHVVTSMGTFGDIGGKWTSKFKNWIPRARGGCMEDFA